MILTKIKIRIILISELYSKPGDKLVTTSRKISCTKCCQVFLHRSNSCLPSLLRLLWKRHVLLCCICRNCLFRYSKTKAVRHRVNYKYSFRTDQLDRFCFPPRPFPAGCDPHLGGLLAALTTVKTKNIRTILSSAWKETPGRNHQENTKQQFCTLQ